MPRMSRPTTAMLRGSLAFVSLNAIEAGLVLGGAVFSQTLRTLGSAPLLDKVTLADKVHEWHSMPARIGEPGDSDPNDRSCPGMLRKALLLMREISITWVEHFAFSMKSNDP